MVKTTLVTGGGHGIGKGIVAKLLQEQCKVIVLDVNTRYLSDINNEYREVKTLLCDVGNPDEVQAALRQIETFAGQIDYVVNDAGISVFEPVETLPVEMWNRIISVNL